MGVLLTFTPRPAFLGHVFSKRGRITIASDWRNDLVPVARVRVPFNGLFHVWLVGGQVVCDPISPETSGCQLA